MNHANRGVALIFNHETYLHGRKKPRRATNMDRDRLEKVLTHLDFDVHVHNDLSLNGIKNELRRGKNLKPLSILKPKISFHYILGLFSVAELDHTQNDCLVITIMTHGDERKIASFDLDYPLSWVTKYFTDSRCPSLKDKPRILFIQACRGKQFEYGYVPPENQALMERSLIYRQEFRRNQGQETDVLPYKVAESSDDEEIDDEEDMVHNPPIFKDFLIVRSTMPGYESYRDTDTGSWFIQELCNELEKNAIGSELMALLTRVNLRVSGRESLVHTGQGRKQILSISSRLTRIMVINDKSAEDPVNVVGEDEADQLIIAVD